jgi:hypothetical protein
MFHLWLQGQPLSTTPLPHKGDYCLDSPILAALSRRFYGLFSLTALGVYDGDFMKFSPGVSAVTLAGGRTYHRLVPTHEGQHALRLFMILWQYFPKAAILTCAFAGLERVNPFISQLENINVYHDDDDVALQLRYSDARPSSGIAAVISLAPAALPTRRKVVIQRKGAESADAPVFLDLFCPFVEPLHYVLLLPYGTLRWSPNCLNAAGKKFSQASWYRTTFCMNTKQMSVFS